ncbi:MAG: cysteine--tRNA ligase [Clostridia bacterium]|nr:cysteine--tRNA ligase [Clostridia bacterium]
MKFYNSLTSKIEEFKPVQEGVVKMYTCGPTVYHFAHIGNLRSYIMEDVLEKTLRFVGYNVVRCMNITDVGHLTGDSDEGEDKMLLGAKRENKTVLDIAKFYTEKFKEDCANLNIKWPEIVVPATSCVDEYINMIEVLLDKGYAYQSNGNVYFDVSKLDNYYTLTNHKADDMLVGVRDGVELDDGKRNQADFALWFTKSKFADQELKWDSPWGVGYPGWHIECSGISCKYLGEYLDIHCGGVDNKFPHHTNEIAQSEAYLGHKWCNYWFHVEHLNGENGKMSKSEGGFVTVDSLKEKGYSPLVYRFFCLMSHYAKPLVFSFDRLDVAKSAYDKLKEKVVALKQNITEQQLNAITINKETEELYNNFKSALEDDLNTSRAITILYDVLKANISDENKLYLIKEFDKVLGLNLLKSEVVADDIPQEVKDMAEARWNAKLNKNWTVADELRNKITTLGYQILDSKDGYTIKKL